MKLWKTPILTWEFSVSVICTACWYYMLIKLYFFSYGCCLFCCCCKNQLPPKAKQLKSALESIETYRTQQQDKLRDNYAQQVSIWNFFRELEILQYIARYDIGPKSFTSLKADLSQVINRGFAFNRCLNGTFLWRKCSIKALVS